jgi:pyruvate kinase
VVCTLGPASEDRETIRGLVEAGMSVARLNASHGSTDGRAELVDRVRSVVDDVGRPVATMVDISGPEVRTAALSEPVDLEAGSRLRLVEGDDDGVLGVTTSLSGVEVGDSVLFDNGRIETIVESVEGDAVVVTVDGDRGVVSESDILGR